MNEKSIVGYPINFRGLVYAPYFIIHTLEIYLFFLAPDP